LYALTLLLWLMAVKTSIIPTLLYGIGWRLLGFDL
jgi:hypothetical protein